MVPTISFAALFAAINLAGGLVFAADKRAAIRGARRVPERVLLTLAAAGAAPAMVWLAGRIRHKTRKQPFRSVLNGILATQLAAAAVLGAHLAGLI